MAKRRVKSFKGQKETLPIKDRRLLNSFMNNLLLKRDLATTDVKRYQADRNYMIALFAHQRTENRKNATLPHG